MRRFFILLWRLGRRDLRLLWYALHHPQRPAWLLPATLLLLLVTAFLVVLRGGAGA